jgi:hypothetical protein
MIACRVYTQPMFNLINDNMKETILKSIKKVKTRPTQKFQTLSAYPFLFFHNKLLTAASFEGLRSHNWWTMGRFGSVWAQNLKPVQSTV